MVYYYQVIMLIIFIWEKMFLCEILLVLRDTFLVIFYTNHFYRFDLLR